ncbi:hypothetical protein RchiOBHm_Chr6g0307271 [Rosa chinensis]|uniref:Uncharacterized protein n=1 Tax=Rosa chinensis TaxID=74649 RepID=A0A2P6Q0E1_ROSCH|nr:hypothetical protein RchiOBHm_Chr6g0307271 [Rosa chinensis]
MVFDRKLGFWVLLDGLIWVERAVVFVLVRSVFVLTDVGFRVWDGQRHRYFEQ